MYDVIVIGGGLVGASTAYHLVRAGARVLLLDRGDAGRATDAGAGILAPAANTRDPEAWYRFAASAVAYYPQLVELLAEDGVTETGYSRVPLLVVAANDDELPAWERVREVLAERLREAGAPAAEVQELRAEQARQFFPPLAEVKAALLYTGAARVDGRRFSQALLQAARRRGLIYQQSGANRLEMAGGRVLGVYIDDRLVPAGSVVIAGGAWSAAFGRQLGVDLPVVPQRGQIAHLVPVPGDPGRWPMVRVVSDFYLVPWPDGRVAAGATREAGVGFDPRVTAGGVRHLLTRALDLAPGLAGATLHEVRVGLRPLSADGLPVLGAVPGVAGVYLATGHGPTGLQLGPYSGKRIADLVGGRDSAADLAAFSVTRFATPGDGER
ncbi:MAG TPA: FAD-dependent oxidoreductase [Bacillota bacterium]